MIKNYKNLSSELTRTAIVEILQEYELPISTVYYIIKDIYRDIEVQYKQTVQQEYEQSEKEYVESQEKKGDNDD